MSNYTDFLYARPSFLEGMARTLDFAGVLNEYNESMSAEQADYLAMRADWRAVGEDLRHAVEQFNPKPRREASSHVKKGSRNRKNRQPARQLAK